jgi:membrane-bound serine protease (ClpP class)
MKNLLRAPWQVLTTACLLLGLIWLVATQGVSAQGGAHVDVLNASGAIDTWMAGYIERGIGIAERDGAQAVVVVLDTPGGTLSAMQRITTRMLNARVPVIVYVSPSGAAAGSAGTFVTLAANIAAMAPGTTIGAAHPVDATGQNISSDERDKVTNYAVSMIQSIAQQRGRNADWAAQAVRDSVAATAQEALQNKVIDLVANDLNDLLNQVNGQNVQTAAGELTLQTGRAGIVQEDMNAVEMFFHTLVDPNIALALLLVGLLALAVELYNPGAVVPAVAGGICLVLAFVSLGSLPVNWGAVILIVLSVIMLIIDVKVNSIALTVGGLAMFVIGALMLFAQLNLPSPILPAVSVSPVVVLGMGGAMAAFFLFVLGAAVRGRRYPVLSGREVLIGATGTAMSDLTPGGQVHVRGELWSAVAQGAPLARGDAVQVVGVDGLRLVVVGKSSQTVAGPGSQNREV